jgi:hypothetical protein
VLATAVVAIVMNDRVSQRSFKVQYEFGRLARVAVAAIAFGALALPIEQLPFWTGVGLKAALALAFVACLPLVGAVDRSEMAQALAYVRAKRGGGSGARA